MDQDNLYRLQQELASQSQARNEAEQKLFQAEVELKRLHQLLLQSGHENQALLQKANRLSIAIDGSGDGVWEFDFITGQSYFSDTYKSMLGYAPHEMEDRLDEWRNRIHPEDLPTILSIEKAYAEEEINSHQIEYRLQCKDGSYKWILERGKIAEYSSDKKPLRSVGTHSDVDNRKQLQIQLQTNANRMSSLLLHLPEAVLLEDEQKKVAVVNQKFCDLFHINKLPASLIGRDSGNAIQQDQSFFKYPEAAAARIKVLWEEKNLVQAEKLETNDGRVLEFSYIPIFNNEVFEGHLWVYHDITERLRNRQLLQHQRRFYEDILNNIPSDIVVLDAQDKYLFINPTAVKDPQVRKWMLGITQTAYHAARPRLHGLAATRHQHFSEALATKKAVSWEEEILGPSGDMEYHIRNLFPVINAAGEVEMVIAHGTNITHRKKSEQLIQVSEKRYRDMVNFSQAIIITHDLQGKILMVNPAGCNILGYSQNELLGQNLQELMAVMTRTGFRIRYLEPLQSNKSVEGIFVARHKDGSMLHLLYKNHLLEETGGEPYVIGFAQNITHLVKAETELKMAKLLAENASTRTEAFLANMSHEIRTPMNGIMGVAALLKKTSLDGQQQKYLRHIQDTANNLLVIVNDVLDLEKIVAGKLEMETIPFLVEEKVGTVIETFRYKAEEKGLMLEWQNNLPENLTVLGDPFRLGQILNNLISNAMKFTDKGSIAISASALRKNGGSSIVIEYAVADSGIGIAANHLDEVFTPFVQEKSDVARKYGGTGLGLSICKNLVEMQGGNISVRSEPGMGSTFSFHIPYLPCEQLAANENILVENRKDFAQMKGKKVLVAEDVELNQFLARHILESWGVEVAVVANGALAVERVQHEPFDLILMDIQMPVMNGMQAAAQIRTLSHPAGKIPIIALTANALRGDSDKYLAAGMDSYLSKPFTEDDLFAVMDRLLFPNDIDLVSEVSKENKHSNLFLYDLGAMEAIAGGNKAFLHQLVALFISTAPDMMRAMKNAVEHEDWDRLAKETHKMKPQVQSMGINKLVKPLHNLEQAAKSQQNLAEIPEMLGAVDILLDKALVQLQHFLE